MNPAPTGSPQSTEPIKLTRAQYLVVLGLLEGKPNKAIARELDLSLRTIEYHRAAIYAKADVTSPIQLGVQLERRGFVPYQLFPRKA